MRPGEGVPEPRSDTGRRGARTVSQSLWPGCHLSRGPSQVGRLRPMRTARQQLSVPYSPLPTSEGRLQPVGSLLFLQGKGESYGGDRRAGSGYWGLRQADVGSDTHNLQATQLSLKSYPPLFLHSLGAEDSLELTRAASFSGSPRPFLGRAQGGGGRGCADREGCKLRKPNWPTAPCPAAGKGPVLSRFWKGRHHLPGARG